MAACATGHEEVAASKHGGLLKGTLCMLTNDSNTPTISASLLVVVLL